MMDPSTANIKKITLLFVCVSDIWAEAALALAEQQPWTVTHATFTTYISDRRRPHIPDTLRSGDGCVAVIDFDNDPDQAGAAALYLQQIFQHRIIIIAVSTKADADSMLVAMRAGCTEFLTSPEDTYANSKAFQHAENQLSLRTSSPQIFGSVLAMLGAKGGVGTTTLGVHLAHYLVHACKKKVLLIDSKAQFGHISIYLGMDGSGCHFQEVVTNVNRLDSDLIKAFVGHHTSGLDLLSSPDFGQTARPMHPDDVAATLEFLRSEYDFVIVDCHDSSDAVTRAAIAAAAEVYLIATPDITALRDLSRHVDDLAHLESPGNTRIVINRYSSQFAVSLEEIEKAIRMPVSFSVPNNYIELVRSANLGEPVSAEGKSGFTTELLRWAHALVGISPAQLAVPSPRSATHRLRRSLEEWLPKAGMPSIINILGKRA